MPPRRRKSTDYTRRRANPAAADPEEFERVLSPAEKRRQLMINLGVWFLVAVFAMTSGIMCFNIGDPTGGQAQDVLQQQQAQQDPVQQEIDRWTREVEARPDDPVALANLAHFWIQKAETLPKQADLTAASASPAAGSPSPAASPAAPEMSQEEALGRAVEYLERAMAKDKTYVFALQQMANVRLVQEKPEEARQYYEQILALSDAPIPEGEDKTSIEANRQAQKVQAMLGLASLDAQAKKYPDALARLDEINKLQPGNVNVYLMRAQIQQDQGQTDAALASLEEAAKIGESMQDLESTFRARMLRSQILQEKGDKAGAKAELEKVKALAEKTGNIQAMMLVSQLLYAMDAPAGAPPALNMPTGPSPAASPVVPEAPTGGSFPETSSPAPESTLPAGDAEPATTATPGAEAPATPEATTTP